MDRPSIYSLQEILRTDFGLLPAEDWPQVRKLAAIGLALLVWRNTASLESIHSDPDESLSDAEMMRLNIAAFYLALGSLSETGFAWEDLEDQLGDPSRNILSGRTVEDFLGDGFPSVAEDSQQSLAACREIERREGAEFLVLALAVQGGTMARGWFGSPWWPDIVEDFIDQVRPIFDEAPSSLSDPGWLRETLLVAPERLDDDVIYWCLARGLGWDAVEAGFRRWQKSRSFQ